MALPDDEAGNLHYSLYIPPTDRYRGPLEDFEKGPIALSDSSEGIDFQVWALSWNGDETSPNYGDFTLTPEDVGGPVVVLNVPNVTQAGASFDQNGHPFICYITDCAAYYWWYDFTLGYEVTVPMAAGVTSVACCVDDHRPGQLGQSDIILAYNRLGTLYYRQERERFDTERTLQTPIGTSHIERIGMNRLYRLQWDGGGYGSTKLSTIVGDLCHLVKMPAAKFDVSELESTIVRGFTSAGMYSSSASIQSLQKVYFFDMPQIDGELVAVRRGGDVSVVVTNNDCVQKKDINIETAREQGVEFPRKFHLAYSCAEYDYTSSKATSERRSYEVLARSEATVDTAVNFTPEEAAGRADAIHKIAWNEFEGTAKFAIPESFAATIPSDLMSLEIRPGTYKRMRLVKALYVDGYFDCEAIIDRKSSYTSGTTALPGAGQPPEAPNPTLPGDTTWEFMDIPALLTTHDTLRYYAAARGDANTGWHGAQLQRLVGSTFLKEVDLLTAEKMGQVEAALGYGSRHIPDTGHTLTISLANGVAPESVTHSHLYSGGGAWLVGDEILQVRDWVANGANWDGTYILRGRLDTPIPASHSIGERVVFLGNPVSVPVEVSLRDTSLTLRAPSYGQIGSDAVDAPYAFIGRSQEEWAPIDLVATRNVPATNDWTFAWTPRYRLGSTFSPIPSTNFYGWRFRITISSTTIIREMTNTASTFIYTEAMQIADWGSAQSSFTDLEIRALNHLGGEGKPLNEAVS